MSKIKRIIISLVFVLLCVLMINPKVKAINITLNTTDNIAITDVDIKDSKKFGLQFNCEIYDNTDVKEYGVIFANGKVTNNNTFYIGSIVNGYEVLVGSLSLPDTYSFSVSMIKIPKEAYVNTISARCFIKTNDDEIFYSKDIIEYSLFDACFLTKKENKNALKVKEYVLDNYVLTGVNSNNNYYFQSQNYEVNYYNLRKEFFNDFLLSQGVSLYDLTPKEFYKTLKSSKDNDISDSLIYLFFNDPDFYDKWLFLTDYFECCDCSKGLFFNCLALRNGGTYDNINLHYGDELIYSVYNFFYALDVSDIFNVATFTDLTNYYDAVSECKIFARTVNNIYLLKDSIIKLSEPISKNGYKVNEFDANGTIINIKDDVKVEKKDIEFMPIYKEINYDIKYIVNELEVELDPSNYTIASKDIILPSYRMNGYSFEGWYTDKAFTNKVDLIPTGSTENITLYAKMVETGSRVEDTYKELASYFNTIDIVESNLDLPKENEKYLTTIEWESSNDKIINSDGKLARDYKETIVTLTAHIKMGVEVFDFTFDVKTKGYKPLVNIASSYIYSNYREVTPLFFDTLDIINCAFVHGNADGTLSGYQFYSDVTKYIIDKAHEKGIYVIASLAPNTEWETIANPDNHLYSKFANEIVRMINKYGFDGVDIDWEHPNSGQFTWFTNMMKEIYRKVKINNKNHLVTAAIYGGKWQPPCYDLKNSKMYMDYINLMCYGMTNTKGYYQNALYKSPNHHDPVNLVGNSQGSCSIEESVNDYYTSYGIEKSQLIPGYAFYGIAQKRELINGNYTQWKYDYSTTFTKIKTSILTNPDYTEYYDEVACVPYILNKDKTEFISYDNARSVKDKCDYVVKNKLAGLMYWQNGQDTTDTLLTAMKEGLNK